MLQSARSSHLGQLAALLVAMCLAGAARSAGGVVAPRAAAHRCTCKAHGADHECSCPVCQAAAVAARLADAEKVPPCHREAARAAARKEPRSERQAPCVTGSCGSPEERRATASGLEPFPLLRRSALPLPQPAGLVSVVACREREAPRAPETPPPRA